MPTSSVGKTRRGAARAAGVTLIEMLVVVALISLMVGISYPAITSGIDSLRLNAATNSVVSFLDYGLSRAERRQQMVEITISKPTTRSRCDPASPASPQAPDAGRRLHRAGASAIARQSRSQAQFPALSRRHRAPLGLQLINRRNVQRVVRVDPITGVPRVEAPEAQ